MNYTDDLRRMFPNFTVNCNVTETEYNMTLSGDNFTTCDSMFHRFKQSHRLVFDDTHVTRIWTAWTCFAVSLLGNFLVLLCVTVWRKNMTKTHTQTLMLNISIANLCFTFVVMPTDAIWQKTLQWYGGGIMCRIVQATKQFSMFVSSFMVATMEMDRAIGLLRPISPGALKVRLRKMLTVTWMICILASTPALGIYDAVEYHPMPCLCPSKSIFQCIDFSVLSPSQVAAYTSYTSVMSFFLPLLIILICFTIIAIRITQLARKNRETEMRSAGFRNVQNNSTSPQRKSLVRKSLERAKRLSQLVTCFITLTFVVCWGPYYLTLVLNKTYGEKTISTNVLQWMLMTLYLSPCLHPLIIILLLKDVRRNLGCKIPCAPGLQKLLRSGNKCSNESSRNVSTQNKRLLQEFSPVSRTTHV